MSRKALNELRRGSEFVARAEHDPLRPVIVRNGGSHVKITTGRGMVVVPVHPGDLHHGLLCAIRKQWLQIGLTALGLAAVIAGVVL